MAEEKRRFHLPALLGDGALLLYALLGLAGSFLSLYTGPEVSAWADVSVLARCAADGAWFLRWAALFALLSLCVWSLPRFWGAAAGGLAALWLLWLWWSWDGVLSGAMFTCKAIADLFAARVDWGHTFPFSSGLGLSLAAEHTRLFLVLALAGLALALGWAIVRARRWWLAVLLTLPPLLPGLLADFYPHWPAFLALCACWFAMLLTALCRWAAPSSRGRLTLAALAAVVLVLGCLTLLLPREGYTRPAWALKAYEDLTNLTNRTADYFSRWDGPFQRTVTYVGAAEEANLSHAGPLNYSGRTVLRVTSDYDGRLYLRGSSLAVYGDGVWKALPEGTYQAYLTSLGDQESTLSPLVFPAELNGQTATSTVTVNNVGAVGACVYTPYFLTGQDWAGLGMLPVEDAYFARLQGQWEHTMGFCPAGTVPLYSVDSAEISAYRDYARMNYLDVPQGLAELLLELCRHNGIYGTDYYRDQSQPETASLVARQVTDLLDSLCEYDPKAPAAPDGVDPVQYFLNESRRGYCMHYASAATLMLRSLGVPTRYVSGFTAESVPGRTVNVPDRAAHAWVEVWVDGFGWHPVEVTPDAAFDWYEDGIIGSEDLPSDPLPEESEEPEPTSTPEPDPTPDPTQRPSVGPQADGEDGPDSTGGGAFGPVVPVRLVKALAVLAGVCALLWLGQFLPKHCRAKRLSGPDRNRAALYAYACLKRMERWSGQMDGRAVELAQKAKFSQHTLTEEELDELRALVDRERTRLCVVLRPLPRLACRYWWGMARKPKKPENGENSDENRG